MTPSERAVLVERLVKASGDPAYREEAATWTDENLMAWTEDFEQAAADVRRYGHLGAVWHDDARAAASLAKPT